MVPENRRMIWSEGDVLEGLDSWSASLLPGVF